jgi:hypothetical protein
VLTRAGAAASLVGQIALLPVAHAGARVEAFSDLPLAIVSAV